MTKQKTQITIKFWKTIIAVAILQTQAELLTVQYTKEDGSSHTRLVEDDIEVMFFTGLKSITLPEGLKNLRILDVYNGSLTNISLPERLSNLEFLSIRDNQLTNLSLPEDLPNLAELFLTGNQLTSLSFPKRLVNLRYLSINTNPLTSLKLPEDLAKNTDERFMFDSNAFFGINDFYLFGFVLSRSPNLERLSVHYEMREFSITQRLENENAKYAYATIPAAKELIKNESLDSDGFFKVDVKIDSEDNRFVSDSVLIKVYGAPPTIRLIPREDGLIEIVWRDCILQKSPTIDGPWAKATFIGEFRLLRFPSQSKPSEFFRVKPWATAK